MIDSLSEGLLADQLLVIVREPRIRQAVYEELGEYCHMCRNRLNSLKLSLFLAKKQSTGRRVEDWERIERHYVELERAVDRVQTICRPMTLSPVSIGLELLIEDRRAEWIRLMAESGCELECVPPPARALAAFDVERMGQALDALIRWRAGDPSPGRLARLRWWVEAGTAHLAWEEERSTPVRPSDEGATWNLPLLVRIVLAHGGDLRLTDDSDWRLRLSWPAAAGSP